MNVATSTGVRELRDGLSRHLARVRAGETITVTDHGVPIARIVPYDLASPIEALVRAGIARVPASDDGALPDPVSAAGTVSDLVAEQRP